MKIGIITKIGKNYGALLQAYALKKACEMKGNDAHIIKYTPDISRKSYKIFKFPWGLNGTISNLKSFIHYKENKTSTKKFLKFREDYFSFIGEYKNDFEIKKNPPVCDLYISGSDQVWNPNISFDEAFYLTFIDDEKYIRVSYAASIGLKCIPEKFKEEFKNRVKQFSYISVREKKAQEILFDMGIKSEIAPDPTFLIDVKEWNKIAKEVIKDEYILCYFVSFDPNIITIINKVKKQYNYKVVNLMTSEESSKIGDIKIRTAGPEEFLGLFKNASFVITSSFHGTVFSIFYKKKFLTTLYKSTSSRIIEVLDNLELSNRIVYKDTQIDNELLNEDIYSDCIDEKMKEIREHGWKVLNNIFEIREKK